MNETQHFAVGFGMVVGAGFMQGGFPVPMKFNRIWAWENTWLISSIFGLVAFPWLIAAWTVPQISRVLADAPVAAIWVAFLFGAGWGIGGLLFGLGVHRVGLSLTLAIVIGLTSALGSLLPLAIFHPGKLLERTGVLVGGSVLLTLIGLYFSTSAGRERERTAAESAKAKGGSFWSGALVCIASGVLSPMFNFALICGDPLIRAAAAKGAGEADAPNLVLAIAMTGGLIPTALYCGYLLLHTGTWKRFQPRGQVFETSLAVGMGVLFAFSNSAYASGATRLGKLGAVVGWPVFMAIQVIAGNVLGYLTGEWTGAGRSALTYMLAGSAALIAAVFLIAMVDG
jgi:L-rhamnose-H+ transport protein